MIDLVLRDVFVVRINGTIAVTTSLVRFAAPGLGPYSAIKGAVAPGPVDTDLFLAGKDEAALQRSAVMSPFNRVGEPREFAEVVRFLASDKASWVAGQVVQPNGGLV